MSTFPRAPSRVRACDQKLRSRRSRTPRRARHPRLRHSLPPIHVSHVAPFPQARTLGCDPLTPRSRNVENARQAICTCAKTAPRRCLLTRLGIASLGLQVSRRSQLAPRVDANTLGACAHPCKLSAIGTGRSIDPALRRASAHEKCSSVMTRAILLLHPKRRGKHLLHATAKCAHCSRWPRQRPGEFQARASAPTCVASWASLHGNHVSEEAGNAAASHCDP